MYSNFVSLVCYQLFFLFLIILFVKFTIIYYLSVWQTWLTTQMINRMTFYQEKHRKAFFSMSLCFQKEFDRNIPQPTNFNSIFRMGIMNERLVDKIETNSLLRCQIIILLPRDKAEERFTTQHALFCSTNWLTFRKLWKAPTKFNETNQ